jgi:hypothetical protein
MANSALVIIGMILIVLGSLGIGFNLFSVAASGCKDLSPYASRSPDGNTITLNSPGFYYSCPAEAPISLCGAGCFSLPIDLSNKEIQSISISITSSKWYSRWTANGIETSEVWVNPSLQMPQYTSVPHEYLGAGKIELFDDGLTFSAAGTDGQRNYRASGPGPAGGASPTYAVIGQIILKDKPQPEPPSQVQPPADNSSQDPGTTGQDPGQTNNTSTGTLPKPLSKNGFIVIMIGIVIMLIGGVQKK